MDPATLMAAGGVVSAIGSLTQGFSQARNANANAAAMENNAIVADNNVKIAGAQANAKEEQQRRQFRQLQGEAVAGAAQSGTAFSGSTLDVLKQNEVNNELDARTIRWEGANQQNNFRQQASMDRYNADIYKVNAKSAVVGGFLGAGADLLSAAGKYKYFSK